MSINVNVHGNPVKIRKGKMVTATPDYYANQEFQKRRRMRLEQVRQQSKDLAETVRNRVKKEQGKQLSKLEKQGERDLKKWQATKLLQLQQQYQECLKDIGLGHTEAIIESESDHAVEELMEKYKIVSSERGDQAVEKMLREREEELKRKQGTLDKKKIVRSVENTRSQLVADLNKKKYVSPFPKRKRRMAADINIYGKLLSESSDSTNTESEVESNFSINSGVLDRKRRSKSGYYDTIAENNIQTSMEEPSKKSPFKSKQDIKSSEPSSSKQDEEVTVQYPVETRISDRIRSRTLLTDTPEPQPQVCDTSPKVRKAITIRSNAFYSMDNSPKKNEKPEAKSPTRIEALAKTVSPKKPSVPPSFRGIKRITRSPGRVEVSKGGAKGLEECDCLRVEALKKPAINKSVTNPAPENEFFTKPEDPPPKSSVVHRSRLSRPSPSTKDSKPPTTRIFNQSVREENENLKSQDSIPSRPTVALKLSKKSCSPSKSKVQYYDHSNRFSKEYLSNTNVQRIADDSIEVCASEGSEAEFFQQIYRRDQEAEKRGKRAMQKEKARRDYQNLMQRLPMLQKQERVATIPMKKSLVLSKERLKQEELKKQTKMEDAYEKLFPKARIVTIPSKGNQPFRQLPFQTISVSRDETPCLNVGSWDMDVKPPEPEKAQGEKNEDRKKSLQNMLSNLQFHRDKLAKELSALPPDSPLCALNTELSNIDKIIQLGYKTDKNKPVIKSKESEYNDSRSNSPESTSPKAPSVKEEAGKVQNGRRKERKTGKQKLVCTDSSTSLSPPVQINLKKKGKVQLQPQRIILQNTSTQTTPIIIDKGKDQKEKPKIVEVSEKTVGLQAVPEEVAKNIVESPFSDEKKYNTPTSASSSKLFEVMKSTIKTPAPKPRPVEKPKEDQVCSGECYLKTSDGKKELCEIVIKISDNMRPKICINPKKHANNGAVKICHEKGAKEDKPLEPAVKVSLEKATIDWTQPKMKPSKSWRDFFSQNSSSSTSYMSPPNFATSTISETVTHNQTLLEAHTCIVTDNNQTSDLVNILRDRPQQGNIMNVSASGASSPVLEPSILAEHVKKLLSMSRRSIDELPVSSVSDIATPGSSIVNIHSNVPNVNNFLKQINMNMTDVEQLLDNPDCKNASLELPESSVEAFDQYSLKNYPGVLAAYNKLAESCAKRIENLAAMIDKVRLEKINMMVNPESSGSDKENSTQYMDLPKLNKKEDMKNVSSNNTAEQEELDRQMLEIDYGFAEQLKKMTTSEIKENFPMTSSSSSAENSKDCECNSDRELLQKFSDIIKSQRKGTKTPGSGVTTEYNTQPKKKVGATDFSKSPLSTFGRSEQVLTAQNIVGRFPRYQQEPALMGIQIQPDTTDPVCLPAPPPNNVHRSTSRPPPSKGLIIAKRLNSDISVIPHELSTIIESESLLSSRAPKSNKSSQEDKDKSNSKNSSSTDSLPSLPDILTELMNGSSTSLSSPTKRANQADPSDSSNSDLENMEQMLKALGMGWAVAALHKMQEALALASSSSSTDLSAKGSEASLKDAFEKQMAKLSTGNMDSSDSRHFSRDLRDLSVSDSQEKTRRTSTPVHSSRSPNRSRHDSQPHMIATGESELSSVRAHSDNTSDYGPFYSLNESSTTKKSR